ncbi:MAG: hypothetical protein NVSMB26_00110 [Beijerinckiaceae bacterium]
MLQMAACMRDAGIPVVFYFHGLEFEEWPHHHQALTREELRKCFFIVNSEYTAIRLRNTLNRDALIVPPLVRAESYRVWAEKRAVTFVNPVAEKGLELALGIAAACPEIPFDFVKGWPLSLSQSALLKARIGRLPNVTLLQRTHDMREIYRRSRLLLVPSIWQRETWGRVASEAQCSGIPSVACKIGGLTEAVGPGGILLRPEAGVEAWAQAVRSLWHDNALYNTLSVASLTYSMREEFSPQSLASRLLEALSSTIQRSR